mmetsp:Transcript_4272/g.7115  ORF Transcript_4272/g.7115 Transcript_4272/m.7115 type:complete len:532 (-) Transcript_4272:67-1662(-)|eukprot:CAMPEP_0119007654 /NCGR_PEP_ID=MMETSP1176-20130426/3157_1 /TAXON_ID=265551 /ORGANISM="Synedropsis recta cf, Strain CCMP1620" /LENGTH=531 /DNA_ID=CAMNT_0006959845 /DNA_START=93 /DNA_END=1688 /DNA_ORIENTATION=+
MKLLVPALVLAAIAENASAFHAPSFVTSTTSCSRVTTSPLRVASDEIETMKEAETETKVANGSSNSGEMGLKPKTGKHATPTSFATKCASLYSPKAGADRGLSPPVYFGSTFSLDDARHGARLHEKREAPYTDADGFVYSRWGSPTNEAAAMQIAALEGVDDDTNGRAIGATLLFNSGMSAITSALMAVLRAGDHIILPYTVYGGTHEFTTEFCVQWGIEVTFVDASGVNGPANYKKAFQDNTRVVYTETPANPTMRLTDLAGVGRVVDEHYGKADEVPGSDVHARTRPFTMCDGTFATPYHQRVLDIPGMDVSIHSATKYLGGHSDILAGSVTSRSEPFLHACSKVQKLITVPLNPMDSFLLARGMRTLDVRMQRHGENAIKVARMLDEHPMVAQTFYPGLDSHPDRSMADDIFRSGRDDDDEDDDVPQTYGGMISFIVQGEGEEALRRARNVCEYLRVIHLAVSLGGVESLCEHPASMTHTMIPREQRIAGGLHDGLIRISIGLEKASDLVNDLRNALNVCDEDGCEVF